MKYGREGWYEIRGKEEGGADLGSIAVQDAVDDQPITGCCGCRWSGQPICR